jgi:hypothetical protein
MNLDLSGLLSLVVGVVSWVVFMVLSKITP